MLMEFTVRVLPPANEFIDSMPSKMQSKIYRTIDLLREFGYKLQEPSKEKSSGHYV
jgi:hypothetical protein